MAITSKTKAIIAVHLYGNPANTLAIKKITKGKKIKLIEDCAQAHGAKLNNSHVGTTGDLGTFSFFPGKNSREKHEYIMTNFIYSCSFKSFPESMKS